MDFQRIFEVFSRRPKEESAVVPKALSKSCRNRVLFLCRDRFGMPEPGARLSARGYGNEFWGEIYTKLQYLCGRNRLSSDPHVSSFEEDAIAFLLSCPDDHFLDFIEYIFQVECYWKVFHEENEPVEIINRFLSEDDLPYFLTSFVRETRIERHFGGDREVSALVAHPRVIRRDDQIIHRSAIQPALTLLSDGDFSSANAEFLDALKDYRHGDFGDCLTKCGSAFESTMKILCSRNNWLYNERDTASTLIRTVVSNSNLEGFFEQPFTIIATLRNRLSGSHGAGTQSRVATQHRAKYAINATASAIVLLVEECG